MKRSLVIFLTILLLGGGAVAGVATVAAALWYVQQPQAETSLAEGAESAPSQPFIIGDDPDTAAPEDDKARPVVAVSRSAASEPAGLHRPIVENHQEHERLTSTPSPEAEEPRPRRTAPATTPEPETESEPSREPPSGSCDTAGVTRHSASRYTLSRGFINRYIRDQDRAQRQGSAGWRKNRQQDVVGVRIRNLRCAPRTAGLQNNDVIKAINGRSMTSITAVLTAYAELKRGNDFTVKVRRDNQPLVIQYTVE